MMIGREVNKIAARKINNVSVERCTLLGVVFFTIH